MLAGGKMRTYNNKFSLGCISKYCQNYTLKLIICPHFRTKLLLNGTHQPSSGDDESVFARLGEERLCRFLFASTESWKLVSPVCLTNPQLLTGDTQTTTNSYTTQRDRLRSSCAAGTKMLR